MWLNSRETKVDQEILVPPLGNNKAGKNTGRKVAIRQEIIVPIPLPSLNLGHQTTIHEEILQ